MRKILVLRGGALGDFIVTLPALALLRRQWPGAQIELAGNATAGALARNRALVNVVHSQHEARWSALFSQSALPAGLAASLGEYDLILNFWPDPEGELARRFPLRAGQVFLSASALPQQAPAAAHYCAPLRQLGLVPTELWFPLSPLRAEALSDPKPIAVHPGSGSATKNWRTENWQKLIREIPAPVLLVLGEAEPEKWDQFGGQGLVVARNLPLEELVARLAGCGHFVGHDSGVSHLAAATGVPCTLLFGPTDPGMWAPPAPNVRVIQRGPMPDSISVAEVRATLPR